MDMYSMQHPNGLGTGNTDGSGTINPAALNSAGLVNPPSTITPDNTPRGLKRSHTPDTYADGGGGDGTDEGTGQARKRGRPMKPRTSGGVPESPVQSNMAHPNQQAILPPQTPQSQTTSLPPQIAATPTQSSPPPKTTPKSVIKALPTVRDHTTDQLGPEGDEYIPREYDEAGEKKVTATGHLNDNREYRCRTFFVPHRGDKLFMLATECARVLGYRDSYLLFNKNRSLYKIIATQAEKEDLIHQEILPFSYRSRQIAIVTAKSMFRQFGSRVIVNGRRVRDDYWETKARKQGFTEDDMAGEKRPGAAKAREAASAEAANTSAMLSHPADIIYSNTPVHFGSHPPPPPIHSGMMGAPNPLTPLPMITLAPEQDNMRLGLGDYRTVPRPRQEITGPAYQDRTQGSSVTDMMVQAQHAADFNKSINQQRGMRTQYIDGIWRKPHEAPPGSGGALANPIEPLPTVTQAMQSPRTSGSNTQSMMPRGNSNIASGSSFQTPHAQNPIAQSPMRTMSQTAVGPDSMRNRSPSVSLSSAGGMGQGGNPYNFQQTQMWPPPQPQQSPQQNFPSYGAHGPQLSPQIQQSPSQQTPSLRHSSSNPQMQPMQYTGMQGMPQNFPGSGRGMYSNDPTQQYMQQNTPGGAGSQNWAAGQQPQGPGNWGGGWQQ